MDAMDCNEPPNGYICTLKVKMSTADFIAQVHNCIAQKRQYPSHTFGKK